MSDSSAQMTDEASNRSSESRVLLLFSFGPVQPFIAAARKTADLWAGSTLLSRLAQQAIAPVQEACGEEALIFPYRAGIGPSSDANAPDAASTDANEEMDADEEGAAAPNRFVAAVPKDRAEPLAQKAEDALQSALQALVSDALEETGITETYPRELGHRQAETFLDVYWCILPLESETPYGTQYRQLERLLGARKATRDFEAAAAPGYRCDLIPKLAALVPDSESSPGAVRNYWKEKAEDQPPSRLREGEELSAIALAKRAAPGQEEAAVAPEEEEAFPSTSSLATAGFKARVLRALPENDALRDAVEAYETAMQPLLGQFGAVETPVPNVESLARRAGVESFHTISGEWLFEESFDTGRLERQGIDAGSVEEERRRALSAFRDLRAAASDAGLSGPSRYYALLLLDGDQMGKWLSGEKAPVEGEIDRAYHQAVSRALSHFAEQKVPQVVESDHLGRVVYSGGDDVLAFSSLRDALPMARSVRAAFSGHLAGAASEEDDPVDWGRERPFTADLAADAPTMGAGASASAGLVFAHHMQPLDQVLSRARAAEKVAKDDLGRNALACALMKRSGEHLTTGGKWHRGGTDLVKTLTGFAELLREDAVSTGFLHTVRREVPTLGALSSSAVRAELQRIFARQGGGGAFDQTVGALLDLTKGRDDPLRATTDLLEVGQFIGTDGT